MLTRRLTSTKAPAMARAWIGAPALRRTYAARSAASFEAAIRSAPQDLTTSEESKEEMERRKRIQLEHNALKKLSVIDDPYHIKQAVDEALRKDQLDRAMILTEKASRSMATIASWNAIIQYQLKKGELKAPLQTFNNMKKRGHMPNVQTYTILFSGMARSEHPKRAMAEAVKHYNILLNDPRIEPNTIHINAVLSVCARARDMDQLMLVAGSLDEKNRSPDSITYTTLIDGMRHCMLEGVEGLTGETAAHYKADIVQKAQTIWSEVIDKWYRGKLRLDERLVCSMGRMLVYGESQPSAKSSNYVLDLFEQTMGIPNYATKPGANAIEDEEVTTVTKSNKPRRKQGAYVLPSPRTLSLLLQVLGTKRHTTLAIKYWNKLTNELNVLPDEDNYFRMLICLKRSKSSAQVAQILESRPAKKLNAGHFVLGMETCIADNINPNVVGIAGGLLDQAEKVLPVTDIDHMRINRLYLRAALVSHHALRARARLGEEDAARATYARQIMAALERLWEPYKRLHYQWFRVAVQPDADDKTSKSVEDVAESGDTSVGFAQEAYQSAYKQRKQDRASRRSESGSANAGEIRNSQREVIALARDMYGAYNKILNEEMLPPAELQPVKGRAAKINREIQKFYTNREDVEPKLGGRRRKVEELATGQEGIYPSTRTSGSEEDSDAAAIEAELALANEGAASTGAGIRRTGGEFVWNTRAERGSMKKKQDRSVPSSGRVMGRVLRGQ